MDTQFLKAEVKKLVASPRGILAIDESLGTCTKRFQQVGVESTEENRRKYRELLVTCPGIEQYINGMILVDETIHQKTKEGIAFPDVLKNKGISAGITVYTRATNLALHGEEQITEGLDMLRERYVEYKNLGATFSKWRATLIINTEKGFPSDACLHANMNALARYAAICQESGLVPIVEPETIMDGSHTIDDCYKATERALIELFKELKIQGVYIPGVILKPNMVISGTLCSVQAGSKEIAEKTLKVLKENVPANIGGIVFLSGGQSEMQATENLRVMHQMGDLPWPLTFSYGRAIQNPALKLWAANMENIQEAQNALLEMARNNSNAVLGK